MKKTLTIIGILIGFFANAQILGYSELGLLLSSDNHQGSARSMGMKGAFGALGGDLSAISINPASGAIFTHSTAAFTLGFEQKKQLSEYYGMQTNNLRSNLDISQAGGLLIFDNNSKSKGLTKIAVAINYAIKNNFKNKWESKGKSSIGSYSAYPNVISQYYQNLTSGKQSETNFSVSAQFNQNLFIGTSLNIHSTAYIEDSTREEIANNSSGHSVDSFESYWQEINGGGFSIGFGAILKATQNLRLGLSYTSPVWHEIHEESNIFEEYTGDAIGYFDIIYYDNETEYAENTIDKTIAFDYQLQSPSKLTGSIAYVFADKGLISADLSRKDYKGIKLSPNNDFTLENQDINEIYTASYKLNLGTEWRFKEFSVRGGYSYEQSPIINAIESDNLTGFSLGLGYDFGNFIIDVGYDQTDNTAYYDYYPGIESINGVELTKFNNKVLASVVFKL